MPPIEYVRSCPKIAQYVSFALSPSHVVPSSIILSVPLSNLVKLERIKRKMSANAALISCPICLNTSVFDSVQSLRDRLIQVSTNKIPCPVCQEEIFGLDKLTIHLFKHVQLLTSKENSSTNTKDLKPSIKCENETNALQKKPKSLAKNRTSSSAATVPVKFVKIYPKLPVISLNPVPIIEISQTSMKEAIQTSEPMYVKTETAALLQPNTTCNICGLQFVDNNILRMHRCLIHNIDENTHQTVTRYNCHLCPKNFKMRGSLMVHLRVAHYGFLSCNSNANENPQKSDGKGLEDIQDRAPNFDMNDSKQWQCDVCRKCFTTKYFLKKHKRLHTGETPYSCTQCNKTFTFQQSYHKHLLYHNDEKPHTCTYCGRAFKELSTLHNHQRIHTGEKPFACETCGKCFRQRVSYLVHRRIHTGVMPYKCTACEKNFRYKVSQRTHKCQVQPPGTVVRQTGNLVEKLKMRHPETTPNKNEANYQQHSNVGFIEVSEASAELVRTGAKISLEDMESENFRIISEPFNTDLIPPYDRIGSSKTYNGDTCFQKDDKVLHTNIEDLIEKIPTEDKNVPSPSEILKKLSLSKEEEFGNVHEKNDDLFQDFNIYL